MSDSSRANTLFPSTALSGFRLPYSTGARQSHPDFATYEAANSLDVMSINSRLASPPVYRSLQEAVSPRALSDSSLSNASSSLSTGYASSYGSDPGFRTPVSVQEPAYQTSYFGPSPSASLPTTERVNCVPLKRRSKLPEESVAILKEWIFAHCHHPYPNDKEKEALVDATGLTRIQISNWLINARRRLLPKTFGISPSPQSANSKASTPNRSPDELKMPLRNEGMLMPTSSSTSHASSMMAQNDYYRSSPNYAHGPYSNNYSPPYSTLHLPSPSQRSGYNVTHPSASFGYQSSYSNVRPYYNSDPAVDIDIKQEDEENFRR